MNFQSLKGMIDTLVKTFHCPECNGEVNDGNVDIIGAAGKTINIDIVCEQCGRHSILKTEIHTLKINNKALISENIGKLKESLLKVKNTSIIKTDEINELNKSLNKEKINVSDLLG